MTERWQDILAGNVPEKKRYRRRSRVRYPCPKCGRGWRKADFFAQECLACGCKERPGATSSKEANEAYRASNVKEGLVRVATWIYKGQEEQLIAFGAELREEHRRREKQLGELKFGRIK